MFANPSEEQSLEGFQLDSSRVAKLMVEVDLPDELDQESADQLIGLTENLEL